jgi:putative FmdB family regulatory protein
MPIYEYECVACGKIIEAFQKFSDAPLTKCEGCRGKLKRLISNTSFQLKGSGWYVTDYARTDQGGAKAEKANQPAEAAAPKAEATPKAENKENKKATE